MLDDFEIKRRQLLNHLKNHRKSIIPHKPQAEKPLPKLKFAQPPKVKNKNLASVGLLSIDPKTIHFVEREGERVANFEIFDDGEKLLQWVQEEIPPLVVLDIDPPLEERIFMDCISELPILSESTKPILLTKNKRNSKIFQLTKMGIKAVMGKPIQLLDVKSLLNGVVPHDCRPPTY